MALAGSPIVHQLNVDLTNSETLHIEVRTPSPEHALIIKTLATRTRNDSKDLLDIYNLLLVADSYDPEEISGWRLDAEQLIGARAATRIALHTLVQHSDLRSLLSEIGVSTPDFIQLAREKVGLAHIARP